MKTKRDISSSDKNSGRYNKRLQRIETDPALSGVIYILKERPWQIKPDDTLQEDILREDY